MPTGRVIWRALDIEHRGIMAEAGEITWLNGDGGVKITLSIRAPGLAWRRGRSRRIGSSMKLAIAMRSRGKHLSSIVISLGVQRALMAGYPPHWPETRYLLAMKACIDRRADARENSIGRLLNVNVPKSAARYCGVKKQNSRSS